MAGKTIQPWRMMVGWAPRRLTPFFVFACLWWHSLSLSFSWRQTFSFSSFWEPSSPSSNDDALLDLPRDMPRPIRCVLLRTATAMDYDVSRP